MAIRPVTVSQLNGYIKRVLQTEPLLGDVVVEGEVSNLTYHSSGHVYFSLKDDKSVLRCFLARPNAEKLSFLIEEGMKITAAGYVSVFERGGYYSLNVKEVEESGVGDLAKAFDMLKEKLLKEGLFDERYKKPIPFFPKKVVLVTAPAGAAVRDMTKTIRAKNIIVDILIYPVLVQGPGAASDIAKAIDHIGKAFPSTDVMILGRGGGSTEDLWAFNEEVVARAIFRSKIPVISAVGHETDHTISDFVADMRAPTPTAAAEMAVPSVDELRDDVASLKSAIDASFDRGLSLRRERLESLDVSYYGGGILNMIEARRSKAEYLGEKNRASMCRLVDGLKKQVGIKEAVIEGASPRRILRKGYTLTLDHEGKAISSVEDVTMGDRITVVFRDGRADADVIKKEEDRVGK